MKMKPTLAHILSTMTFLAGFSHGATVFQLDFSTVGGSQAGWETLGGIGNLSKNFSGYTGLAAGNIVVSLENITFNRNYSNNAANLHDFPGTDLDAMYRDLLFRNTAGSIPVTIGGLKAGTYQITTYHVTSPVTTASRFDLKVQDADSPAFAQTAAADIAMGQGNTTTFNPTIISFEVNSNGTDPIILQMNSTLIGTGGNTGGWWGINGLEIVPEPSTALLSGLGLLALLRRRR